MRISFFAPRLPPAVCGIADHTRLLAEALRAEGVEVAFIHREALQEGGRLPEGPIHSWDGSRHSLQECIQRQQPDWLWLQLSSYGYSRWGAPWRLGRVLQRLRRALPTLSVAVCAHETHCQPHQLGRKGFLLSPWQRFTVGAVVRQADLVFTSIPRYVRQVVEDYGFPSAHVVPLPIGSNIPQVSLTAEERAQRRRKLGWSSEEIVAVTFGSYGSQLRALQSCGEYLARGLASGHLQRIVSIGGQGDLPSQLTCWTDRLGGPAQFQALGYRNDREVAEILACCDFAFCAYSSELLGKSTAFAAFALAGLAILVPDSSIPEIADAEELPIFSITSWDWNQNRSAEIGRLRQAIRDYALARLSWASIARRALAAIKTSAGQSSLSTLQPESKRLESV